MPLQLLRNGFRLLADERSRNPMLDAYTGAAPQAWARADSQFEVGLARANRIVDVTNLSSVSIRGVDRANIDGGSLFAKTLAASALDDTLTDVTWNDGTRQHALFPFSSAEMNLLTSPASRDIFVVITALTLTGEHIVCGTTTLTMVDDGAFTDAASPPTNPGSAINVGEADARYAPAGTASFFAAAITSVGDNATTSLERLPTATLSVPMFRSLLIGGVPQDWYLLTGTDANDALHQRPNDFDASTNPKVWTRLR